MDFSLSFTLPHNIQQDISSQQSISSSKQSSSSIKQSIISRHRMFLGNISHQSISNHHWLSFQQGRQLSFQRDRRLTP